MSADSAAPGHAGDGVPSSARPVTLVHGLSQLAADRDVLICDIWGVIHNGIESFADSCAALARFRAGGGTVVLVSNAPRPFTSVLQQLEHLGVRRDSFDAIVTSGDITRGAIAARAGEPVFMIGPPRDRPIFDGLAARFVPVEEATYVVCTGLFDDETETAETYRPMLTGLAGRKVPFICANPDLVVERGDRLIPCAGALAALYATLGGETLYAGKPHAPIYETAVAMAVELRGKPIRPDRILAIGDSIHTDVAGSAAMGFDCLFVARGIHAHEVGVPGRLTLAAVTAWAARQPVAPAAVIPHLRW
ncbi:TIGR01459 family HAD-type hydrolase [Chelatococcus reniformis]|uniref:Haloacid dehalogenase n=1 Tax=Chelatococcus reniformis TaxID=1494448 RepID=A0A916XE61_9HYPH|nr:TIGR01459 family HAD-type hydrolase [Chelatococcus reniformis]GGC67317.1 haloacid dehalogenase [Chelatococcus reniformis]